MADKGTITLGFRVENIDGGMQQLVLDSKAFNNVLRESVKLINSINKEINKKDPANQIINTAAEATTINAASTALNQLNGVLNAVTGEYADFSAAMRAANTMAGKSGKEFDLLKDQVSDLSKSLPIAREELANGLYQVVSNGVPENNWISFLEASARSAVGGMADLGQTVNVTSTIIKNYGLEWNAARDIQDKIQLTAKNGVTSFEQLAQALPRVTGNAATLGVTVDELLATFATLTGVSGNTAEVSTQLAAIFTALVKPSSEATKMAAQMGIQFDAAAIKAAGGFDQFLAKLDESVKAYAASSGMLEQEIYGKLFGSAESLRAMGPLVGNLSAKFTENVAAMKDSAGVMDEAFDQMNQGGDALAQRAKNWAADTFEFATSFLNFVKPYTNGFAVLLAYAADMAIVCQGVKALGLAQKVLALRTKATNLVFSVSGAISRKYALGMEMMTLSTKGATRSTIALKVALRGLLIASGIGIVIWALSEAFDALSSSADDATDATGRHSAADDAYERAATDATLAIDKEIKNLKELMDAHKDTTDAVQHLNDTYGEVFDNFKTAADWYDTLISKGKTYARQLGLISRINTLNSEIVSATVRKEAADKEMERLKNSGDDKHFGVDSDWLSIDHLKKPGIDNPTWQTSLLGPVNTMLLGMARGKIGKVETDAYRRARETSEQSAQEIKDLQAQQDAAQEMLDEVTAELGGNNGPAKVDVDKMTWNQADTALSKVIENLKNTIDPKKQAELLKEKNKLEARKKALDKALGIDKDTKAGKTNKRKIVANPTTESELRTNISLTNEKLTGQDTQEQRQLLENIRLWKEKLATIERARAETERPSKLDSEDAFDREIAYWREYQSLAMQNERPALDKKIANLEKAKKEFIAAAHQAISADLVSSFEELETEINYYTERRNAARDDAARIEAQTKLNQYEKIRTAWQAVLDGLDSPGPVETLDTLGKIEKAVSYVDARIQQASGNELAALERQKNAYEAKRRAMMRTVELTDMRDEADRIDALSGKSRRREITGIGYDGLTDKISELRRQLDDVKNPVTDEQRRDIESLIETYETWRRESIDTWGSLRQGYGEIKNVGSAITGITDAIDGNGNAWEKLTGIVDGFLQLFDGIKAIVDIINLMTAATKQHTTAKQTETAVTVASTGATVADTAATETDIGVKSGDAIANATKSGAALPFPLNLVAIAAGVAAVIGALAMIGSFSTGGIVGGSSPQGDRLLARVNSGEMILNKAQQTRLYNALNGNGHLAAASAAVTRGAGGEPQIGVSPDMMRLVVATSRQPVVVGGTMRVSGRDLVCTLANETRIASRSGRRTGIRL